MCRNYDYRFSLRKYKNKPYARKKKEEVKIP